jgi:glycerate kinase
MLNKIIVASDSFKGSLSSMEVADCVEKGVRKVFADCDVVKIPVADGGEGTMETLVAAMKGRFLSCTVHDPLMRQVQAQYGISGDGQTAIIEMATASGLTLIPDAAKNPLITTTFGTGELIKDALLHGCQHVLIGIGGSATNDAGVGMLQALGYHFLDMDGKEIGYGGQFLNMIADIDSSNAIPQLHNVDFTAACDVNNPFSGANGAAFVYARQKGATDEMIRQLDKGMKHFASVIKMLTGLDVETIPGAGAAGGLGGGLIVFLKAELKPGIQMILDALHFDSLIQDADLIITGEGKLDSQTRMGKTPVGVLIAGKKHNIPVVAIGGAIEDIADLNSLGFKGIFSIQPYPVSLDQAMNKSFTCANIERTIEQILRIMV